MKCIGATKQGLHATDREFLFEHKQQPHCSVLYYKVLPLPHLQHVFHHLPVAIQMPDVPNQQGYRVRASLAPGYLLAVDTRGWGGVLKPRMF